MRLEKIIARSRIIDLHSATLRGALEELLSVCAEKFDDLKPESLLRGLLARESTMTTYLGHGVSLPHVRVKMKRRYILAIGRSRTGIRHEGTKDEERVNLIFMLLAGDRAPNYLQVLASIARQVREPELVHNLANAPDLDTLYERLVGGFDGIRPVQAQQNRTNRLLFREAQRVASGAACSAIMVFGDTFIGGIPAGILRSKIKTILVSRNPVEQPASEDKEDFNITLQVRAFSNQRMSQLRSAILMALTHGALNFTDRICCIGGVAGSNQFDTLSVVEIEREFQTLLTGRNDLLPIDVKPEVLERVIAVATELAIEGREGKPVGSLFVVGDIHKVEKLSKPLVLNPFYGYKEEDRNILNPFMDETVKEFSSIDGAFLIGGDGVLESAGSLIQAVDPEHSLPSGLGSRHAAAAAISLKAQCIAIVVSSSGQVTLFRRGVMLPLMDRRAQ